MDTSKGWSRDVEKLLKNWSQQIGVNEKEHRKRGTYYRNWYYGFGVFVAVTQACALTILLSVIVPVTQSASECSSQSMTMLIIAAIIQAVIAVAQAISTFFNFGSGSEQYYEAAKSHNALHRYINSVLSLSRDQRDPAREVLLSVRQQFDHIQETSPSLPSNKAICKLEDAETESRSESSEKESVDIEKGEDQSICVSAAQQCRIDHQLQGQRLAAVEEDRQNRGFLQNNLEYQWKRFELHKEIDE